MSLISIAWISVLIVGAAWLYLSGASMVVAALKRLTIRATIKTTLLDDDSTYGAEEGRWPK